MILHGRGVAWGAFGRRRHAKPRCLRLRPHKAGGPRSPDFGRACWIGVFPMRPHTLSAHLSIPEDSLRNERIQVADQLKLVRKLREEGRDESAAMEVLQVGAGTPKRGHSTVAVRCPLGAISRNFRQKSSPGPRSGRAARSRAPKRSRRSLYRPTRSQASCVVCT